MIRHLRRWLPRLEEYDGGLLLSVFLLCLLGCVMVFGAASYKTRGLSGDWDHSYYLVKHLARLLLGVAAMLLLANWDYRRLRGRLLSWSLVGGGLVLVALPVALAGRGGGLAHADCKRWFDFGLFPVQPLELTKIALVLFLAGQLVARSRGKPDSWRRLGTILVIPLLTVAVLAAQPNYGNALIIGLLTLAILFVAGLPLRLLGGMLAGVGGVAAAGILLVDKISSRVSVWLAGLQGETLCYQVKQALIGIGAGGVPGVGIGNSHQRVWFLPESHTDFIYAVVGEELGLVGSLAVLGLFGLFAWRGFGIARRAGDPFGQLTAIGLTTLICLYVGTNIAMVVGLFPVIGVPLPFVSYGGSALVTNLAAVGILLSIDRHGRAHQVWRERLERVA
jgi:cell division protein FtsW